MMLSFLRSTDAVPNPPSAEITHALAKIRAADLRRTVEILSVPRHIHLQPGANCMAAGWIAAEFAALGYSVEWQNQHANIIARHPKLAHKPTVLVGAHYDSVAQTPGADDNASAIAALLAVAGVVANSWNDATVAFVAFNGEEEGLLGSRDFVQNFLPNSGWNLTVAHILEMVGYRSFDRFSQRTPPGLPVSLPDVGDFVGIVANSSAQSVVADVLACALGAVPQIPMLALTLPGELESTFADLLRSDHAPFWEAGLPAMMWTDTAEFRNPNYHKPTDTPDTLDYDFLVGVAQTLAAHILNVAASR